MSRNLGHFTRGSQMLETFTMMFTAGLKPLVWTACLVVTLSVGLCLWRLTLPHDGYFCIMRAYTLGWDWMGFDAAKVFRIRLDDGTMFPVKVGAVAAFPPVAEAWHRVLLALLKGLGFGLLVATPAALAFVAFARNMGEKAVERIDERGEQITSFEGLAERVTAYNSEHGAAEYTADLEAHYGNDWAKIVRAKTPEALIADGIYLPYTIAGISYPWRLEATHLMALGTTGTGKSTVLKDLVVQIRARGKRAVVFDLTGAFVEAFYNPDTDILMNPLDERCPLWTVFNDCETKAEFTAAAEAMIPHDGGGSDPFWVQAARLLFVEACIRLKQQNKMTNDALYDELMTSSIKTLHTLVENSVAGPLTDVEAKRMAESIRAVLNTNMTSIDALPRTGKPFSIRDWIINEPVRSKPIVDGGDLTRHVGQEAREGEGEGADGAVHDSAAADSAGGERGVHGNAAAGAGAADTQSEPVTAPGNGRGSILFIVARYVDLPTVKVLLTLWMDMAINTLMAMSSGQRDVRVWFLFDELGALHKLPALERALTTGRGFGGAVVLGIHTISKLRDTYGEKIADTLASLCRTKLILATPDHNSAKWCSEQIGSGEWRQMEQGISFGVNNVRDAMTLTQKRQYEALVLPDDIAKLPSLSGWLKLPEGMPAAPVTLQWKAYPKVAEAFKPRKIPLTRLPLYYAEYTDADGVITIEAREGNAPREEGEGRMAVDAEIKPSHRPGPEGERDATARGEQQGQMEGEMEGRDERRPVRPATGKPNLRIVPNDGALATIEEAGQLVVGGSGSDLAAASANPANADATPDEVTAATATGLRGRDMLLPTARPAQQQQRTEADLTTAETLQNFTAQESNHAHGQPLGTATLVDRINAMAARHERESGKRATARDAEVAVALDAEPRAGSPHHAAHTPSNPSYEHDMDMDR